MRIKELTESYYLATEKGKLEDRFNKLGIKVAYDYFVDWIYYGQFNLPYSKLDRFEQAFYLINSVLPPEVLRSYAQLPVMYRGMKFSKEKVKQIYSGGLPIKSRIMAWSPNFSQVLGYYADNTFSGKNDWVVLKHKPVADEVIISLNAETMKFLKLSPKLVANSGETILSIPILKITPEMVERTSLG